MEAYICTRKNTFFYIENIDCKSRRGAGVAERGSLLRSCTFTGTGGSNPFLSAIFNQTCFLRGCSEHSKQPLQYTKSGCSVARSSRLVWDEEVAGSNPATPTEYKESILHCKFFEFIMGA
jgi:hypothetical protein